MGKKDISNVVCEVFFFKRESAGEGGKGELRVLK